MKDKFKLIIGNLAITFCLLVLVEAVFYFIRPKQYRDVGFLLNIKQATNRVDDPGYGPTEVDPLLGYNKSPSGLEDLGFKVENGCVVLSTTDDTAGLTKILITGGSVPDISLHSANWPVEFCKILKDSGIKAQIYVGAVGGHNSGQELLKLIRDELGAGPLIHISYSGTEDFQNGSYVSKYEQRFYEKEFSKANTSWLLPNTVLFMRNLLRMNHPDVLLRPNDSVPPLKFWERNMSLMHSVAMEYHYNFIAVLQPRNEVLAKPEEYHKLQKVVQHHPDYMVDLSDLFDTHLVTENESQLLVARSIYNVLEQKKLLKK